MRHPFRSITAGTLTIALFSMLAVIPPVRMSTAQPGVLPPRLEQASSMRPFVVDPATLPVVSEAPQAARYTKGIFSPDPDRAAAKQGNGPAAPDVDRSSFTASAAPAPRPKVAAVNFTFNGIAETTFNPPDQALAAGPNHLVEQVNSTVRVYDKAGASVSGPFSLQTWYGAPGSFVFDPVGLARKGSAIAGDQLRFYEVALFFDAGTKQSLVMVAVSSTNSGTSSRCIYHFSGRFNNSTADDAWFDFPKVGVTHDPSDLGASRLLIGGNLFRFSDNTFVTNTVLEINKQQLDSCVAAAITRWIDFRDYDSGIGFTPVPTTDYDDTAAYGWHVLLARYGSGTGISVWRNRFGTGWEFTFVDTLDYVNPPDATQPGTATRIDVVDDRLQSAVTRYGKTWGIHTVGLSGCGAGNNVAALHLFSIDTPKTAAAPSLSESPSVPISPGTNYGLDFFSTGPCGTHRFNGAVSQDAQGNALWVYTESGGTTYPHPRINGYHLVESAVGAPVAFGAAPCACTETGGRWGDYSAVALDSLDQRFLWVASEILTANNVWGTRIGRIIWSGSSI